MSETSPPVAAKKSFEMTHHGHTRNDPYAWLRDDNWQEVMRDPSVLDGDIRTYLEAENAHTATIMDPLAGAIETLFAEMKGRIKEDDSSVPLADGPWAYFQRYREGGQHPIYCRQPRDVKGDGTDAQVLFEGDKEAEGQA